MINLENALKIKGMVSHAELSWLAEQASTHKMIVEIGSYHGMTARAMADNTEGQLVAIDTWVGPLGTTDTEPTPTFEHIFKENLQDLIDSGKVSMAYPTSGSLEWITPDMVFIDGDHTYKGVMRDIQTWKRRLIPGGLMCGHDIQYPDVYNAVRETFNFRTVSGTQIWFTNV